MSVNPCARDARPDWRQPGGLGSYLPSCGLVRYRILRVQPAVMQHAVHQITDDPIWINGGNGDRYRDSEARRKLGWLSLLTMLPTCEEKC